MHLVWFRSDLRTIDNPALHAACADPAAAVKAIYFITEKQWLQHDWGANKIGFVLLNVLELQRELAKLNIPLEIIYCNYFKQIPKLLIEYAEENNCTDLYFNREYELNERTRDNQVKQALKGTAIKLHATHDQCLIPPGQILNKEQKPYAVFTPFKKATYNAIVSSKLKLIPAPAKRKNAIGISPEQINKSLEKYLHNPILENWPAGPKAAQTMLHAFCDADLLHYKEQRDFPNLHATSKLSAYLAVGAISSKQCFLEALHSNENIFPGNNTNIMCWIDELIWRDFYRNVIYFNPDICKGENYNKKYDNLKWNKSEKDFAAWCKGQTGIPIIDAAMRQLVQTGWMHNRLRMIVAMFLTKQLLIDWRKGEKFFSEHLVDLDFASNNGGWQWCASTGTDAVPYFRIFNPITQSQRFDPAGEFIRKYCHNLSTLNAKQIHDPSTHCADSELHFMQYPKIIVDLKAARARALQWFKVGT